MGMEDATLQQEFVSVTKITFQLTIVPYTVTKLNAHRIKLVMHLAQKVIVCAMKNISGKIAVCIVTMEYLKTIPAFVMKDILEIIVP